MANDAIKLSITEKILFILAVTNFIPRGSLNVLAKNPTSVRHAIQRLEKKKFIKISDKTYKDKYPKRKMDRTIKVVSITRAGLEHLINLDKHLSAYDYSYLAWIDQMPNELYRLEIVPPSTSSKTIINHCALSTATAMAYVMGASFGTAFVSDYYSEEFKINDVSNLHGINFLKEQVNLSEEKNDLKMDDNKIAVMSLEEENDRMYQSKHENDVIKLSNLVISALELSGEYPLINGFNYLGNDSKIRFTNRKIVKQIFNDNDGDDMKNRYGRYAGIFESKYMSVLTYVAPKKGFSWNDWIVVPELVAYKYYLSFGAKYADGKTVALNRETHACLLVENPRQFADIFYDKKNRRKLENKGDDPLGTGLEDLVVFSITYEGAMAFEKYLSAPIGSYHQAIIERCLSSDIFYKNEGYAPLVFPFLDKNDVYYFDGTIVDIKKIQVLLKAVHDCPDMKVCIICDNWQVDYYKRVLDFECIYRRFS